MRTLLTLALLLTAVSATRAPALSGPEPRLTPADVFALEYASDPQLAPDGRRVAYVRRSGDIMTDRFRSSIWIVGDDGSSHRALVEGPGSYTSPRWAPEGHRLLFTASEDGADTLRVLDLASMSVTTLAELPARAESPVWSPDGTSVAFAMFTKAEIKPAVAMPVKPEGAEWAEPAVVIDTMIYRADGQGFIEPGSTQIYVVPADAGTPRRLTFTAHDTPGPLAWTPDRERLIFSANLIDPDRHPLDSDLYELEIVTGETRRLTSRFGPDESPALSPDGSHVAYVGFDDRKQGFQVSRLSLLDRRTGETRVLTSALDRSVSDPAWTPDGSAVCVLYDDHGVTTLARVGLDGTITTLAENLGGQSLGRPYPGASFTTGDRGRFATVVTSAERPADVAIGMPGELRRVTDLNADLLGPKDLAAVEELNVTSSFDGRPLQAWMMRPPGFDPAKRYPMILEIHGGPFANYGPRFSAEFQLFAAAGYVVVYANPRGSTSYGEEFGNLIHHAYPSEDYDDLMDVVDAVVSAGFVDEDRLFVTGGSGGGVLTAWIVGKTDRFRAAVVAKPVINWISFTLYADAYSFFSEYWFPGPVWDHLEHYWARSPLSLVGNVTTPTMLLTGENDLRTPIAESEQYYQALQLRGVPTRMVRVPGASHGIAARPTGLIMKVAHILDWFEHHDTRPDHE